MTKTDDDLTYINLLQITVIAWELCQITLYSILPIEISWMMLTGSWVEIPLFWAILSFAKWAGTKKTK